VHTRFLKNIVFATQSNSVGALGVKIRALFGEGIGQAIFPPSRIIKYNTYCHQVGYQRGKIREGRRKCVGKFTWKAI
jgi:hypothetical protein